MHPTLHLVHWRLTGINSNGREFHNFIPATKLFARDRPTSISPSLGGKTHLSFYFTFFLFSSYFYAPKVESSCSTARNCHCCNSQRIVKNYQTRNPHPDLFSNSKMYDWRHVSSNIRLDISGKRGNCF